MLEYLIISVLMAFGMAIALVEKGNDYPVRKPRIILQLMLRKIYWKLPRLLFCAPCCSFWCALVADISLCVITGGAYFLWPITGFIALGFTWFVIELLNAVDSNE